MWAQWASRSTAARVALSLAAVALLMAGAMLVREGVSCIPRKYVTPFSRTADVRSVIAPPYTAALDVGPLRLIGHQAGVSALYPASAAWIKQEIAAGRRPRDLDELLALGYDSLGLDDLEVDVQMVSGRPDAPVFVLHDPPAPGDLDDGTIADYLHRNRLVAVLEAFAAAGYHRRDKRLYLEIKTETDGWWEMSDRDRTLVRRTIAAVDEVAGTLGAERELFLSHIGYLSFTHTALEQVAAANEGPGGRPSLYWVLRTNRPVCAVVASLLEDSPRMDDRVYQALEDSSWLTGVWFDPHWIRDYHERFGEADARRSAVGLPPLELAYATYYSATAEDFRARVEGRPQPEGAYALILELERSEE